MPEPYFKELGNVVKKMVCEVLAYLKTLVCEADHIFYKENTTLSCLSDVPNFSIMATTQLLFQVLLSKFMHSFILQLSVRNLGSVGFYKN